MKSKKIRAIIISALVLLMVAAAIMGIDIEPATSIPTPTTDMITPTPSPNLLPDSESSAAADAETLETSPASDATENPEELSETPEIEEPVSEPENTPEATPEATPETSPAIAPEPIPEFTPTPTPEPAPEEPERHICSIQIRCDTVVDTGKLENEAVIPFIPASGVILSLNEVEFTPGESVFDVLKRACRSYNVHLEFREDALYSGVYVEGINYLYEYDAGALSGWMYKVNGLFPNYGCAAYKVNDGDQIVWVYTCDLGMDVGDNSSW